MKLIASLSIERNARELSDFWPHEVARLVIVVWEIDAHGHVVALGIDPEHGARIVVEAELTRARLPAFLEAVVEGRLDLSSHCKTITPIRAHHLAVSDPRHLVRRASLNIAGAIRANERLAEAVVIPGARRPPRDHGKRCDDQVEP